MRVGKNDKAVTPKFANLVASVLLQVNCKFSDHASLCSFSQDLQES